MRRILFFFLGTVLFASCNEIMPEVPPFGGDIESNRKVLIEEFTGAGCVQCPAGSAEIENLLVQYPNNLVAVSIHTGSFANPRPDAFDLRTEKGEEFTTKYIGERPFAYPSAIIDRKELGIGTYYVGKEEWSGLIADEIAEGAEATLVLERNYDGSSRTLSLDVELTALADLPSSTRISVLLTESGIVDWQLLPSEGWVPDYNHKHVLRGMMTPFDGSPINEALTLGTIVNKNFSMQLDEDWKVDKMHVIVVLHDYDDVNRQVLQVEEAAIAE